MYSFNQLFSSSSSFFSIKCHVQARLNGSLSFGTRPKHVKHVPRKPLPGSFNLCLGRRVSEDAGWLSFACSGKP